MEENPRLRLWKVDQPDYEDGDDDIFESQVDREVNDHNEPLAVTDLEDDAATGDEDLNLTTEEEEYLKYRFSEFNPEVDMDSPEFKTGMVFANATELRHALAAYSIRNRVKIKKTRNEAGRINAVCENGCTWKLRASSDSRKEALTVRAYSAKHTCESTFELKALTAPFLTRYFLNEFRDNQKMDLATFAAKIERGFNMSPNRWKLTRARNMALTIIHGDEAVQFSSLRDYGKELTTSNPGSKFFLSTTPSKVAGEEEAKEHLSTLYWSYDACTRGFLKGCRLFICIDGCHIKTRMVTKDDESDKWNGKICPKIKKTAEKATELAKSCRVKVAAVDLFHVWSGEYEREYNVDLKARTCDCNRWQLSGIPCHHAIACCKAMRKDPDQYVHNCYSIEAYKRAYAYKLVPLRARVFWEKQPGMQIHPPLYTKVMGRPKKNRKKTLEEKITKDGAKTLTRGGLTIHCSICGKANHNKKGHDKYMQSVEANEVAATREEEEEEDIPSILQVK
ncbi:hypothetical protein ACQ4PT_067889 [Festuca glaucescens]